MIIESIILLKAVVCSNLFLLSYKTFEIYNWILFSNCVATRLSNSAVLRVVTLAFLIEYLTHPPWKNQETENQRFSEIFGWWGLADWVYKYNKTRIRNRSLQNHFVVVVSVVNVHHTDTFLLQRRDPHHGLREKKWKEKNKGIKTGIYSSLTPLYI